MSFQDNLFMPLGHGGRVVKASDLNKDRSRLHYHLVFHRVGSNPAHDGSFWKEGSGLVFSPCSGLKACDRL